MKQTPFCISVDWLQTFCHGNPISEGTYQSGTYTFQVKETEGETQLFKRRYLVYCNKMQVATILQEPRNKVINAKATCVKLENRVLYSQKYIELLYSLQDALSLLYKGITRIDLCFDCNELYGGRNVERFIRQFVSSEPLTKGHIIRRGSSLFTVHGAKKATSVAKLTSIRWGSPKSDIGAYCYNKTLELMEIKDKPWIRETWERNGLVSETAIFNETKKQKQKMVEENGLSDYCKKSVWRFEISIKSGGQDVLNMSKSQIFRLSPQYLKSQPNIEKLFYIYAQKVFDFRINDGVKNIRNYKKMVLFPIREEITAKPVHISRNADTGRTEKICYNLLDKLSNTYTDLAEVHRNSLQNTMNFLMELQGKKSMSAKKEEYINYLDTLKTNKFLQYEDARYLAAVAVASERQKEIKDLDTEFLYLACYGGTPMSLQEVLNLQENAPIPDTTPPEYIW